MANEVTEPEMRHKLLALAADWFKLAREFEREAAEYEETLQALRRHLGAQDVVATKH